jgi:hypothetical protein
MDDEPVVAKFDVDAQDGDIFRSPAYPEEMIVKSVKRMRAPSHIGDRLDHATITLATKREWERMHPPAPQPTQIFNVGTAGNVAGRDVNVTNTFTAQHFLSAMTERIQGDPAISAADKKTTDRKSHGLRT